jgi:hypothetical protein
VVGVDDVRSDGGDYDEKRREPVEALLVFS